MTVLGCIFIPLGLYFWLIKPRLLLPLAIISSVFQAGSVLNVASVSIPPYFFIGILIAFRCLHILVKNRFIVHIPKTTIILMLIFWFWVVLSAIFLPLVFAGMPVIDPRTFSIIRLGWSKGNLFQTAWLTLDVLVAFYAARYGDLKLAERALRIAVSLAIAIIVAQLILSQFGIVLPLSLFHSNTTQVQSMFGAGVYDRPNGLFSEPSMEGVLFTGITLAALAKYFDGGKLWHFVVALFLTLLIRSGASLVALITGIVIFGLTRIQYRGSCLGRSNVWRWAKFVAIVSVVAVFLLLNRGTLDAISSSTINKEDTISFVIRIGNDFTALQVFSNTYGLGIGPGSLRASSLLTTLLATVGIVGTTLFACFIISLLRKWHGAWRWYLIGILLTQVVGVPDIVFPVLWMSIWVMVIDHGVSNQPSTQIAAQSKAMTYRGISHASS